MANMRLAVAARNALADVFTALLDRGGAPGTISIYAGTQPPNASSLAPKRTLLGTLTLSMPAGYPATNGVNTFGAIAEEPSAAISGKAQWARISDSNGNAVFDCDVSGPGGGGTIELNTTDIVEGGPLRISSFSITIPAG